MSEVDNLISIIDFILHEGEISPNSEKLTIPEKALPVQKVRIEEIYRILEQLRAVNCLKFEKNTKRHIVDKAILSNSGPIISNNPGTNSAGGPNYEYEKLVFITPDYQKLRDYRRNLINKYKEGKSFINKEVVVISETEGIFVKNEKLERRYKIRRQSKRFEVVKYLCKKDKPIPAKVFLDRQKYTSSGLSKEIKEINKLFKNKLQFNQELIVRAPTGGYILNKGVFNIIDRTSN